MQNHDPSRKADHEVGDKTAKPANNDWMKTPGMRIFFGVVGLIMAISGFTQMMSSYNEMTKPPLPNEKDRAAVVEKSLASMTEFQDPKAGFSMSYPSNWVKAEKVEAPSILNVGVFKGTVNLSATIEDEPKEVTSEQYAKVTDDAINGAVGKNSLQKLSETDVSIDGTPARKRIHVLTTPSGDATIKVKQVMVLLAKDGKGYCVTGTALEEWFPQFEPVFNKMFESIKIGAQK